MASLPLPYFKAFSTVKAFLVFLPLALIYLGLMYAFLALLYLLIKPSTLVTAVFSTFDTAPNYAAYSADQLGAQLKVEMSARSGL